MALFCNHLQTINSIPAQAGSAADSQGRCAGPTKKGDIVKKRFVALLLAGLVSANAVQASDELDHYLIDQSRTELKGAGIGSVLGAIAAGPPGFIIGAAGGALIARSNGLERNLDAARQEVERLQGELGRSQQQARRLQRQLEDREVSGHRHLAAMMDSVLLSVQFRTESEQLEPLYQSYLARLASGLKDIEGVKVHIAAYTDRRGIDSYNLALSERRAKSVADYLVRQGLASGRVFIRARGELDALYPEQDIEGMGFDRRVLVYLCRGEG